MYQIPQSAAASVSWQQIRPDPFTATSTHRTYAPIKPLYFITYVLHCTKRQTPLGYYLRGTCLPSTSEGAFPHHTGIIGSSPDCINVLGEQGHLQ
ncbi:hypothetical protein SCLCIDRAFT_29691 [Scleroderma citrinum Foug A]|uniref:Uncharacterized protein n=1 Tax=Scleroderma citrinum Foug A TaxID=1036808 RepID=A0A0C3D6H3_9AGAM|nr:hypothetical protein SCLCIDRAFT_29691 [Scleroderma citrinum Foug A]